MKLATPVKVEFTDQHVVGIPSYDRENGILRVTVAVSTAEGSISYRSDLVLQEAIQVTETDADGVEVRSFKRGDCQRLIVNPAPSGLQDVFILGQYKSQVAYNNARIAMKQEDEIAALEAAGLADGWLAPV